MKKTIIIILLLQGICFNTIAIVEFPMFDEILAADELPPLTWIPFSPLD